MRKLLLSLLFVPLLLLVVLGFKGLLPGGDGVVARRNLPDGTQLQVAQTWGGADLGYEVGFYLRRPGAAWGWCYLDHEDSQWRRARIEYDETTGVATVWKGDDLRGRLTLATMQWERPDVTGWRADAPQELRDPPDVR